MADERRDRKKKRKKDVDGNEAETKRTGAESAASAKKKRDQPLSLKVSTEARKDFDAALVAYAFDGRGNLLDRAAVEKGSVRLSVPAADAARTRLFIAPADDEPRDEAPSPGRLQALGAWEQVLAAPGGPPLTVVEIPGFVLDRWPFCTCVVRGRVVRGGGQPVCGARVHICEVDRIPFLIERLPDPDILRLRDDLVEALRRPFPPIPIPDPDPPIFDPLPGPGPDPRALDRGLFRFGASLTRSAASAADDAAEEAVGAAGAPALRSAASLAGARSVERANPAVPTSLRSLAASSSVPQIRATLVREVHRLIPYLCLWPWWWGRLRCDEVATVTTDANGRFQATIWYDCAGDHPDLFFWVEYDLGNGWETVYRPPLACATRWNYACGTEVTLNVTDPRVPGCNDEPDLGGKQVWVISIGRRVSVGEILTSGPQEGMVVEPFGAGQDTYAFGGKLEPRVWFGRSALIGAGITHYLWSYRALGAGPSAWTPMNRQVIRHYTTGAGSGPVDVMGPEPGGANAGRFRIRPAAPPAGGIEWLVADEREDLASAHFVTGAPAAPAPFPACGVADVDAGKYELKLELFDAAGNRIAFEDEGVALRTATNEAPFGTDPVETQNAVEYNRIRESGKTVAFRMVLHVDNSRCGAAVQPVAGAGLTVDAACGVVTLTSPAASIDVAFQAGRPGGLARLSFVTRRGLGPQLGVASAAGSVAAASLGGFVKSPTCSWTRPSLAAATLLGPCAQGAFSQHLRVYALTQDGYGRLSGLDAQDVAAFMLTRPCP